MGRRPYVETPMDTIVGVRISTEEKKELKELCKDTGLSLSDILRSGIRAAKDLDRKENAR